MVNVIIIRERQGPSIQYIAGQVVPMSPGKAQQAIQNGWAKPAKGQPNKGSTAKIVKKVTPRPAAKKKPARKAPGRSTRKKGARTTARKNKK